MKIRNQKGFLVLEGLVLLVILAIVAGLGYQIWSTTHYSDSQNSINGQKVATGAGYKGIVFPKTSLSKAKTTPSSSGQQPKTQTPTPKTTAPTISELSTSAPSVPVSSSSNSGIRVEPVFVPYCSPGMICPDYDLPFPHPYSVYATLQCLPGTICNTAIKLDKAMGPGQYKMVLPPGVYKLSYSSPVYTAQPFNPSFTITVPPDHFVGVYVLHFYFK